MSDWDRTLAGAADATLRGMAAGMRVFGRFVLERKLGQGGMGVVWLGRDDRLEQEVALKFLPENIRMDPVAVADLKRETKRALKLTHPNIVRVHDFHEDGGLSAIAMEYVDGSSLSAVRAEQANLCLEARQLAPLMGPLCAALEYAHREVKLVHRDIKPANLMVDREWRIKITDFGIARSLVESMSRLSAGTSTSGTLVYMSPQQLDGEPPSPSDDIYSLGATMYELLTGKPPFYSGGIERQIMEKVPPPMAQRRVELGVTGQPIPLHWEAVVAACLAKDAAKRPRTAGEVGARLRAGSGSGVLGAGGDPTPKPERIGTGNRHSITNVQGGAEAGIRRAETATEGGRLKTGGSGGGAGTAVFVCLVLAAIGAAGWWFGVEAPRLEAERMAEEQRAEEARKTAETARQAEAQRQAAVLAEKARVRGLMAGRRAGELRQNGAGMFLVWCPAGEFMMGSPEGEEGRTNGEVPHRVVLTEGFWLGQCEVTQGEWQQIMGTSLRDQARKEFPNIDPETKIGEEDGRIAMYFVSWEEAEGFCRRLTAIERQSGRLPEGWEYRLPSEAQWEYACRAGTTGATYAGPMQIFGERNAPVLDAIAWYAGNSSVDYAGRGWDTADWKEKQYAGGRAGPRRVGAKGANGWGLHDMLGNVWEWCGDWSASYSSETVTDPGGPASGSLRVDRGGSWSGNARFCRSAYRYWLEPGNRFVLLGFRVAAVPSVQ